MKRLRRLTLYQSGLDGGVLVIVVVTPSVVVVVDLVVPLQGDLLGLPRRAYLSRQIQFPSLLEVLWLPLGLSLSLRQVANQLFKARVGNLRFLVILGDMGQKR